MAKDSENSVPEDDVEMGFFEHLGELRRRLVRIVIGIIPGAVVAWNYQDYLLKWIVQPLDLAWRELDLGEPHIDFANPIDLVVAHIQIAIVAGLVASAPWLFWQVWGFISPGLYRREKRLALPFVIVSTIFFVGGTAFGYFVVFPLSFEVFLSFAGELPGTTMEVRPTIMIDEYLGFSLKLLLAFGLVFEVPVVITFIAAAGLVTAKTLLKFSRWWIVIAFVIGAILTPPDVGSQLMMSIPLVVLYFISIGIAWLFDRSRAKKAAAAD